MKGDKDSTKDIDIDNNDNNSDITIINNGTNDNKDNGNKDNDINVNDNKENDFKNKDNNNNHVNDNMLRLLCYSSDVEEFLLVHCNYPFYVLRNKPEYAQQFGQDDTSCLFVHYRKKCSLVMLCNN